MKHFTETQLDFIADALVERGYCVLDNALPENILNGLLEHFNQLRDHEFKAAGIGRKDQFQIVETIRSDKIHWIGNESQSTNDFLHCMETVRIGINQRLFLGLFDYESHFAHYEVGAFYKKHRDAFASESIRVLSTVLYLNQHWQDNSGGELVLYADDGEQLLEKILPTFGRMVIFLSEKFPHEVLPATCERNSIAGWFRINQK